jgi:hypothetical protein
LLQRAGCKGIVFGLDHGQRNIGFVEQGEVGPQQSAPVAVRVVAAHHDPVSAQRNSRKIWSSACQLALCGGADVFVADVAFRELPLNQTRLPARVVVLHRE